MSLYFFIKFIHILSSTILFGTGIGTASVMVFANRTKNPFIISVVAKYVVIADWIFTSSSGLIQPVTGFYMVYLAGYSLTSFWIIASIIGYLIAACCWFPVVYLQIQLRNIATNAFENNQSLPAIYFRYYRIWFLLGFPAFFSLLGVFYLMTVKPA